MTRYDDIGGEGERPFVSIRDVLDLRDELAELVTAALDRTVSVDLLLDGHPGSPLPHYEFGIYDAQRRRIALGRWAADWATSRHMVAEEAVLRLIETDADAPSRLVAPRVVVHTRHRGRPLLVLSELGSCAGGRAPSASDRRMVERYVSQLGRTSTPATSYSARLRAAIGALENSTFGARLAAALDRLVADGEPDSLPCGPWHGDWTPRNVVAARGGRIQVLGWSRFGHHRPLGFDTLRFRLEQLRGDTRAAGAGRTLLEEAPRLLAGWPVEAERAHCVARLLLLELAVREIHEVGIARAPVSWAADWIAPTIFSS